jgi:predicted acetyltransferase
MPMDESKKRAVLVQATLRDYPVIQNMSRFYVYDMSRYCGQMPGWECPQDGLFESYDRKIYFLEKNRYPFFIKVDQEIAGFALINKLGTTADVDWNMGEFFVLAKFQGQGFGQQIAYDIFKKYPGVWEVASMPENTKAVSFWRAVVSKFTDNFVEQKVISEQPEPHPMIVLRFLA